LSAGGPARTVVGVGTEPPPRVRVATTSHRLDVCAQVRTDVDLDGPATVVRVDDELRITADGALTVRVPVGTDVVIGSESGRVSARGPLGSVCVVSESGRITIEEAEVVDVRTSSARVDVGRVGGACAVRSTSGRVEVDACDAATISTETGRIQLGGARGPVRAHCVSGRVSVEMDEAADVVVDAVSGRVSVRYPAGVRYRRLDDEPDGGDPEPTDECECTVVAHSVSGRVEVSNR
jgi:DUF4097 and DUF4098 domain-containing protein YvlB